MSNSELAQAVLITTQQETKTTRKKETTEQFTSHFLKSIFALYLVTFIR